MKSLLFFLLCSTAFYSQEYYYNESFIRDNFGKFQPLNKNGYFKIEKDSVCLFNQKLKILSQRVMFDEQSIYEGKIYTSTDGDYIYTIYLTKKDELFFYTRKNEMIKFVLKLIKK
jgi:hypothetical protein